MSRQTHPLIRLLKEDPRYPLEAYQFVREALDHGQKAKRRTEQEPRVERGPEDHLSGQQLCEAARVYAQQQYGYLAKLVLNGWGIASTRDLGEIVYNLIRVREMKKSDSDRIEDFDQVYDFDDAFMRQFQIRREP